MALDNPASNNAHVINPALTHANATEVTDSDSWSKDESLVVTPHGEAVERDLSRFYDESKKAHLLDLRNGGEWQSSIRQKGDIEYDHIVISFGQEQSRALRENRDETTRLLRDVIKEATRNSDGTMHSFAAQCHYDTANVHMHVMMSRFPIDVQNKVIHPTKQLANNASVRSDMLDRLNAALAARGLPKMEDMYLRKPIGDDQYRDVGVYGDMSAQEAKRNVADEIAEAGGIAVQRADAPTLRQIDVTEDALLRLEARARADAEAAEAKILALQAEKAAAIERVTLAQQAQAALAVKADLESTIKNQDATIAEQTEKLSQADATIAEQAQAIEVKDATIAEQSEKLSQADATIDKMGSELAKQFEQLQEQQADIAGLQADLSAANDEIDQTREALDNATETIDKTRAELDDARGEVTALQTALAEAAEAAKKEREAFAADLAAARETINAQRDMMSDLRNELAQSRDAMREAAQESRTLREQVGSLTERVALSEAAQKQMLETMRAEQARHAQQMSAGEKLAAELQKTASTEGRVPKTLAEIEADVDNRSKQIAQEEGYTPIRKPNDMHAVGILKQEDAEDLLVLRTPDGRGMIVRGAASKQTYAEAGSPEKCRELERGADAYDARQAQAQSQKGEGRGESEGRS